MKKNAVTFYHQNRDQTVFDVAVRQQKMESVKGQMMNPLKNRTFGGVMTGKKMNPAGTYTGVYQDTDFKGFSLESVKPSKKHQLKLYLHTNQNEKYNYLE